MITHYLGKDEVAAYCRDLALRLGQFPDKFPLLWCALGPSGFKMAKTVFNYLDAETVRKISLGTTRYNRESGAIEFLDWGNVDDLDQPVLVIDSAVHSGKSMLSLVEALKRRGLKNILTYGLVLKSGSSIVPNYFGVVIDEKDRTYFELDEIPNNRLYTKKPPIGVLREVTENDVDRKIAAVGAPFDELTVGDLLYEKATNSSRIYWCEHDEEVLGFVSFRRIGQIVFIDAWATATAYRSNGIGSALLRWVETWARANRCTAIELWAFESAIPVYVHHSYEFVDAEWRNLGEGQRYKIMRKPLLYNLHITADGVEEFRDY